MNGVWGKSPCSRARRLQEEFRDVMRNGAIRVKVQADESDKDKDTPEAPPRQRPLPPHGVAVAHACGEDEEPYERGQKRLRLVSFPGVKPRPDS